MIFPKSFLRGGLAPAHGPRYPILMKSLLFFSTLLMSLGLLSGTLWAKSLPSAFFAPDLPLGHKVWAVQAGADHFSRQAISDDQGKKQDASHFKRTQVELAAAYGLTEQITATLGGRFRQNKGEQSSQGLESALARVGYGAPFKENWWGALTLQWRQALFKTTPEQTDLALGDDGAELSVRGAVFWQRQERQIWSLAAAYVAPHDLSTEIDYQLRGTWITLPQGPRTWAFSLGVEGVYSLKQGPYQSDPTQRPRPWPSTNLYRSFNRAWTMPFGQIAAQQKNWWAGLKVGMQVQGNSTDQGWAVGLQLEYRGGGVAAVTKKIERFKEYAVEGMVIQVSPRGKFVKIDQGLRDGIDRGTPVDIFQSDYLGQNILVASGTAYQVGDSWAVVRIVQKFKTEPLQTGMIIRAK